MVFQGQRVQMGCEAGRATRASLDRLAFLQDLRVLVHLDPLGRKASLVRKGHLVCFVFTHRNDVFAT